MKGQTLAMPLEFPYAGHGHKDAQAAILFSGVAHGVTKLKTLIRKIGARTYDALGDAAAETLAKFTTQECAAYLQNSGYA